MTGAVYLICLGLAYFWR